MAKVDLNLFIIFRSIYQHGSVSKAAKALYLSQPAISHGLAKLRQHFDDPLFHRQGNQMLPSPLARNIYQDIEQATRTLELTLTKTKLFSPIDSDKNINIAMHSSVEPFLLPKLVKRLRHSAPKMTITSSRLERTKLSEQLGNGEIDIAIDPLFSLPSSISHSKIQPQKMTVAVAEKFAPSKDLTLEYYLQKEHILVSSRRTGIGYEDFELSKLGFSRHIAMRCQHHFAACCVLQDSDLLLTLPEDIALTLQNSFDLKLLSLPFELTSADIHMYWDSKLDKDPANKWLRNQILQSTF
ncbi:LysR family transcriptional regulator [Paraferrimonas sp. SM1919]|uniref:LysR family transcriptional regulator n=1 Tax=Paraferrimonas sp. SM1919 TaxID=2662263 RepID=UPI0013D1F3D4|nr:LysR family transcriptional regulator [Paraferrimonas sp. SM1919]